MHEKLKQLIIIGGGKSVNDGAALGLWDVIQSKFTIGLNGVADRFTPTALVFVDQDFYEKNKETVKEFPLSFTTEKKRGFDAPNAIQLPQTKKFEESSLKDGIFKVTFGGTFALSLGVEFLEEGEIFLLGFDGGSLDENTPEPGIYSDKDRQNKIFGRYANLEKVKIYNVSPNSHIDAFEKIDYTEFFQKLDGNSFDQSELRGYLRKIITEKTDEEVVEKKPVEKPKFLVISGTTPEKVYRNELRKLEASTKDFGVPFKIFNLGSQGSWVKNAAQKAVAIRDALASTNLPVVWTDADSRFEKFPNLFGELDCDVAYYKYLDRDVLTGTIYFANNDNVKKLVDAWIELNKTSDENDQKNLQSLLQGEFPELKQEILPADYCKIFDNKRQKAENPVVVHYQVSRVMRNVPSVQKQKIKDYWKQDGLRNLTAGDTDFPEGWDPVEKLKHFLDRMEFTSVLDLGCGAGRLCRAFLPENYLGVDLNPAAVDLARLRFPAYDFREINFDDDIPQADLTLAYTVFLHLDDERLKETLSKIKSKYLIVAEILGREWRSEKVFNRNLEDYEQILSDAGYKITRHISLKYKHYAQNPRYKDRNTRISFITAERKA